MGQKLTPKQNALYMRTDEVLHYLWDPIGVRGFPGARDEYYSYLPKVFALLLNGADKVAIAEYLTAIERDSMGLAPAFDRAREVATILIDHREWISRNTA